MMPEWSDFGARVRAAHGDYWEAEGRLRVPLGGGATRVRGGRLMSSGLTVAYWNAADMVSHDFDVEAARRWYASRGCEWGVHVPPGIPFAGGPWVRRKRCMGLEPRDLVPAALPADVQGPAASTSGVSVPSAAPGDVSVPAGSPGGVSAPTGAQGGGPVSANSRGGVSVPAGSPEGVHIRRARQVDLDLFAGLDNDIFGGPADLTRAWIQPMFEPSARDWAHWLALAGNGQPVGIAAARFTNLEAGPSGTLSGIGVLQAWRGRGIGTMLTSHASAWLFARGATLVHLNPDTDTAARVYVRLGFREVPGFDIYAMQ